MDGYHGQARPSYSAYLVQKDIFLTRPGLVDESPVGDPHPPEPVPLSWDGRAAIPRLSDACCPEL